MIASISYAALNHLFSTNSEKSGPHRPSATWESGGSQVPNAQLNPYRTGLLRASVLHTLSHTARSDMTQWTSFLRFAPLTMTCGLIVPLGIGCSSPEPTTSSTDASASSQETGSFLSLLYTTADARLMLHDARRGSSQCLVADATTKEAQAVSPTGGHLAYRHG